MQLKYRSIRGATVLWLFPIFFCVVLWWLMDVLADKLDHFYVVGLVGLDESDKFDSWVMNSLSPWLWNTGHRYDYHVVIGQAHFLMVALIVLVTYMAWRSTLDPVARRAARRRATSAGRQTVRLLVAGVVCFILVYYCLRLSNELANYESSYGFNNGYGLDQDVLNWLFRWGLLRTYYYSQSEVRLNIAAAVLALAGVGLLVGAWLAFRRRQSQRPQRDVQPLHALDPIESPQYADHRGLIVAFVLIGVTLFIVALFFNVLLNTWDIQALVILWTAPMWTACIVAVIVVILMVTRPNPHKLVTRRMRFVQEEEAERDRRAVAQLANPATVPDSLEALAPGADEPEPCAVIGAPTVGDLAWNANAFRRGPDWLTLPQGELAKHGAIIGASGTGKTVTLMRLAYLWAKVYGGRVFYLDAKGDRNTAAAFLALMQSIGVQARMFPVGSMDGWRGDATALLNRLMAVENYSEAYYRAIAKRLLTLALNNPDGVPRSADDLITYLGLDKLAEVYVGTDEADEIEDIQRRDAAGVRNRYRAFFGALNGKLDRGWSWEDTRAGYILLDGLSLKDEAASLGRYLLEDFAHYAVSRKPLEEKALLIVDEYSALSTGGTDAANLFERLRSYNATIVISSQSYAGLGKQEDAERILDAANWLLLHRSANPEQLAARAGKERRVQEAFQFGGGGFPGDPGSISAQGSLRLEEEALIHPDAIRRLSVGEAVLIAHGRYSRARMAVTPVLPQAYRDALAWINSSVPAPQPAPATSGSGANGSTNGSYDPERTVRFRPAPRDTTADLTQIAPNGSTPAPAPNGSQPQESQPAPGPRQTPRPEPL